MSDWIKRCLAAPVFEDEDKTRAAALLNTISLTTLSLSLVFMIVAPMISPNPVFSWVATGALMLSQLGALLLMRRGHVRLASASLSFILWLIITLSAVLAGGVRSASFGIYTLVILIAGLLLGWRAGLVFIALSVSAGVGMLWAESNGVLPRPLVANTSVSVWTAQTAAFIAAAALLYLATRSILSGLERARLNERALAESYRQLKTEIAERERAEEALRNAELEKETILDSQLEHVIYQDREHEILWPNRAACESVGMTREELIGRHCYEIWPERAERCEDCPVALAMEIGQEHEIEKTTPDGRAWFIRGYPVRNAQGEVIGAIEVTREITERVQAEKERERLLAQIQEQARQVQQIVDTVPEGVLLLDANAQVVLANPVAEEYLAVLSGVGAGDALTYVGDRALAELLTSPPQGLWHEVATGSRGFEAIARPIETGPTPGGWVLVIRDVTQERAIERRVQQQERLAAVGQLAAGIAHDFNNIMATIVLYAQMAARAERLSARDRERIETINQQAWHATQLIQQILDFSRRAVLERRPLDLVPFLREQVRLLGRTLPESIEIGLAYGVDEYTVNADPTRMQQAVMNLALNARDAMLEGGSLRIKLERIQIEPGETAPLPEMGAGEWVEVAVSDTGRGIQPSDLPRVFDPFFTTKGPGEGTGLGLAQVHGIVAQHEGHIDVRSQVGQGTTFTIYLPALPVHPAEIPALEIPALPHGRGETVLVVEDNSSTRKALVESLELLNYRVLEATDGREALALIEGYGDGIALVLSDMVMPGAGGLALLHSLRERGFEVGVVLLTGHPLEKELEDLRAQGADSLVVDWLLKPVDLAQLAEVVARALAVSKAP